MVLRLGGGDGTAVFGLAGFLAGIIAGSLFLRRGMSLGRAYKEKAGLTQWIMPLVAVGAVILVFVRPSFVFFSQKGPGNMHAPVFASLAGGILVGILGQRSRLCFAGAIRDLVLFRSTHLLSGFVAVFLGVFALNLLVGLFTPGFAEQPGAHADYLWNFLPMVLVGLGAVLLGGCPFRQLILASQGNGDAFVTVMGMITGAAVAHNFGLAASPKGVPPAGMIAVGLGLAICLAVALTAREQ